MNPTSADRLALRLDRLPRGARAGLLAVSIAASFALVGTGAQASPVKDAPAPAGPAVILDPDTFPTQGLITLDARATFLFKSDTSNEFQCSFDAAAFEKCASPVELTDLDYGQHHFRVRAVDRDGIAGTPAQRDWWIGPMPTPTPRPR